MTNHVRKLRKFQQRVNRNYNFFERLLAKAQEHNAKLDQVIADIDTDIESLKAIKTGAHTTKLHNDKMINFVGNMFGKE